MSSASAAEGWLINPPPPAVIFGWIGDLALPLSQECQSLFVHQLQNPIKVFIVIEEFKPSLKGE